MTDDEQEKCDLVKSVRLHPGVTFEAALSTLGKIPHQKFAKALKKHWTWDADGDVTVASKCWFFCWGWSASDPTAEYCRFLWNKVFDKEYRWFEANVGHEFAQTHREEQVIRL